MNKHTEKSGKFRWTWAAGLLAVFALALTACGPAVTPAPASPTNPPTVAPTNPPTAEPAVIPSVNVADQDIVDGKVVIAKVVSNGAGWLVVHAQADGKPGPVVGFSPVTDGTNNNVAIEIDVANATPVLYAMLHTDAGETGTYEFPGPDGPISVDGQVVTPPFDVTGGLAAVSGSTVLVADQPLVGDTITVAEVTSEGPGWIVIHAQADGKPGPVVGYAQVADGVNQDIVVTLDLTKATSTMYAMLHADAGEIGTYEFPGPDGPVQGDASQVNPTFALQVAEGEVNVHMVSFSFDPKVLVIRAGTMVTWTNQDDAQHDTTSDTGVWGSPLFGKGETFSYTFDEPGVYGYYCHPHGDEGGVGMSATIIVIL